MHKPPKVLSKAVVLVVLFVTGCSPSVQNASHETFRPEQFVGVQGWNAIRNAVVRTESAGRYKIKSSLDFEQGSIHTNYSVYGSINVPDRASLSLHENNFNVVYYQQGAVAYALDNGTWAKVDAISNLDVLPSYDRVLVTVDSSKVPLTKGADAFVVNEYCDVYQATLPGDNVAQVALWDNHAHLPNIGEVQFTFYIGKKSHELREVDTSSVGTESDVGAILTKTNTVLFDIGSDIANVQIPTDLVKQLENKTK